MIATTIRFLLIEDNVNDELLTLRTLGKLKVANEVHVVRDGAEALEFLFCTGAYAKRSGENPGVILLDKNLPKVDGMEVLQQIRADPRTQSIPVVMLTASTDERDVVESQRLGVNSYIVKPLDHVQFTETIRELGCSWLLVDKMPTSGDAAVPDWAASKLETDAQILQPLRFLLLEDNPTDAQLVMHALRRAGYDPIGDRVDCEEEFVKGLQSHPEIILADFTMPQFDSLRALEILRERGLDIPFIIVSGTIGEERAVQIMQRGATDYILKDRMGRLGSAVGQALASWRLKKEKQKAEQAGVRLAAMVETSGEAIIATDLTGVIVSWNRAAERLYGHRASDIIGKHIVVLYPHGRRQADNSEHSDHNLKKVSNGEYIAAFETVRVRKDGQRVEVLLSISPMRDENGIVTGASTFAFDITERKRSDRFLKAAQAVTIILTECKDLNDAGPRVLQTIAECLRWEVAVLWTLDRPANLLRRVHFWHAAWAEPAFIEALCETSILEPGDGVAGRAWSSGEPVWERGVGNFQFEAEADGTKGVRCGFGLPMHQGKELVGVIEFYNPELRELNRPLISALENVASQIGQFYERRRVEMALHASEEQFRQLADVMPQYVWTARSDGSVDYLNERWYRISGCAKGDDPERVWRSAVYPDDLQRVEEVWARSVLSGIPHEIEFRLIDNQTGVARWFLFRANSATNREGTVTRWFGTGTDIDDQKKGLESIRLNEERFRNLVTALPAAVYTTDAAGIITHFNEHAVTLWGRRPELGKDRWCGSWKLFQLNGSPVPPEDSPMAAVLQQGSSSTGEEFILERPDGTRAHVLKNPVVLRDAAGKVTGAVNMVVDITKMKQLEEQFRQSQKLEAIGQLAGGVAHDFNNLLTVINGYSEMVMNRMPAQNPSREMLKQVVAAGDRAAGLTRQLLAFSRKAIIAPKILDLKAVVDNLDKMLRRVVAENIEMTIVGSAEVGAIMADVGQIEQVLLNLVVNSGDAMPRGGQITIEVRDIVLDDAYVRKLSDVRAASYVLLAISDTGCGMNEATMAKIFEPFFTTKGDKGTGLGLATVHGIVKQSGGHIAVYSEFGHGTTFKVYFPHSVQNVKTAAPLPPSLPPRNGNETVLFVEDEAGVRDLGRTVLQEFGYTVLQAVNGVDALHLAKQYQGRIDLLVTDVVMPQMGGREVAERLAELRPDTKVLYLSGYTDDAVVRHGILESQVAFLQKPFSPSTLARKVRAVLDCEHEDPK